MAGCWVGWTERGGDGAVGASAEAVAAPGLYAMGLVREAGSGSRRNMAGGRDERGGRRRRVVRGGVIEGGEHPDPEQ